MNDMYNDEQLAHAEIVQKETEDALGFWKDRALKAEAKLADKYLIEEQYETACGDRDGLLRMVETLREQKGRLEDDIAVLKSAWREQQAESFGALAEERREYQRLVEVAYPHIPASLRRDLDGLAERIAPAAGEREEKR